MSLTYENLLIEPYELLHLQELTIRKKMNEHTRLVFKGMVSEEWKDRYVDVTDRDTSIEVWQKMRMETKVRCSKAFRYLLKCRL